MVDIRASQAAGRSSQNFLHSSGHLRRGWRRWGVGYEAVQTRLEASRPPTHAPAATTTPPPPRPQLTSTCPPRPWPQMPLSTHPGLPGSGRSTRLHKQRWWKRQDGWGASAARVWRRLSAVPHAAANPPAARPGTRCAGHLAASPHFSRSPILEAARRRMGCRRGESIAGVWWRRGGGYRGRRRTALWHRCPATAFSWAFRSRCNQSSTQSEGTAPPSAPAGKRPHGRSGCPGPECRACPGFARPHRLRAGVSAPNAPCSQRRRAAGGLGTCARGRRMRSQ